MAEHVAGQVSFPRLCNGVAVIESADSLIVDGAPRRYQIRNSSDASLAVLMRLLDGQHDSESICACLGLERESLHKALTHLSDCGLLEWVASAPTSPTRLARHVMDYYSRNISLSHDHACAEDLAATLANASVMLVDDGPVSALLSADLTEAGVGFVASFSRPKELRAAVYDAVPQHVPRLAVASDPAGSPGTLEEVVRLCGAADVPVLRYASGASGWEIGPVFLAGSTACVGCFRRRDGVPSSSYPDDGCGPALIGSVLEQSSTAGFLAGLLGAEILALIGHTHEPRQWYKLTCIDPEYSMLSYVVVPDAQCAACGNGLTAGSQAGYIAAYEWLQADRPGRPPWRWSQARGARRQTGRPRSHLPTAPRYRLKDDLPSAGRAAIGRAVDEGDGVQPLTAASLGYLLSRVAGARGWAGWDDIAEGRLPELMAVQQENLPLTDLYVLTRADLCNLRERAFTYDDMRHEAIAIRPGPYRSIS